MITRRALLAALPALLPGKRKPVTMPGKPVFGGGTLRYPQIMSPNFNLANPAASPANSWALLQSGKAYLSGLVISVTGSGILIYSGAPAAGTLVESHSPYVTGNPVTATTPDGNGNGILAGAVCYTLGAINITAVQMINGQVNFLQAATSAGPYTLGTRMLYGQVDSPATGNGTLLSGPVEALGQFVSIGGTAAAPTLITTDVWNTLGALAAGSGYTVNNGRFQLDNNGFVMIDVNLTAGAATVQGNYAFANTLPAGQRPPFQCSYDLGWNGTTAAGMDTATLRVSTAGSVTLQLPALPNTTVVSATQRIPAS